MDFELWEEKEYTFCYQRNFVCKHTHTYAHTDVYTQMQHIHNYKKSSRDTQLIIENNNSLCKMQEKIL